jgi:ribosomal-protein-serine acetyltransferase
MKDRDLRIPVDEGLELRLLVEEDAEVVYAEVVANREHLRRFLPFPDTTKSPDDTLRFITDSLAGWERGDIVQVGIWRDGEFVGGLGTAHISPEHDAVEIGYWLVKRLEGKGVMHRSCMAFLGYLFRERGFHRVVIRTVRENVRSQALASRLGFTYEGVQREACKHQDGYHDLLSFSMLAHEWPIDKA